MQLRGQLVILTICFPNSANLHFLLLFDKTTFPNKREKNCRKVAGYYAKIQRLLNWCRAKLIYHLKRFMSYANQFEQRNFDLQSHSWATNDNRFVTVQCFFSYQREIRFFEIKSNFYLSDTWPLNRNRSGLDPMFFGPKRAKICGFIFNQTICSKVLYIPRGRYQSGTILIEHRGKHIISPFSK